MVILILIVVLLAGCASQPSTVFYRSAVDQARLECSNVMYPVVQPYVAQWSTKAANAYFRKVVAQCVAMEMSTPLPMISSLDVGSAALYGFGTGYMGNAPFGAPNSIGPYGTLGPNWTTFNGFFQPTPQQQLDNMLPPH